LLFPRRRIRGKLGLFLPLSPDPERLEITLARIQSTVGERARRFAGTAHTHRAECLSANAFRATGSSVEKRSRRTNAKAALRIYRPPLAANVELREGKPARPHLRRSERPILALAGPWRAKGDWWSEPGWARDEWDVEMRVLRPKRHAGSVETNAEETALYRIYKDQFAKRWFVEGIYD